MRERTYTAVPKASLASARQDYSASQRALFSDLYARQAVRSAAERMTSDQLADTLEREALPCTERGSIAEEALLEAARRLRNHHPPTPKGRSANLAHGGTHVVDK